MTSSLFELWCESIQGTEWEELDVKEELEHIEKLAIKPRIPGDDLIFRIFRAIKRPSEQIKVVLLGQDPYPTYLRDLHTSQARGFSFSAPLGRLPQSLRVIFSEIIDEYFENKEKPKASEFSGDLSYLVGQGVFLLNSYLTINQNLATLNGIPGSHQSWKCFTTKVLTFIKRKCPRAIYLALGKDALEQFKQSQITRVIECDHPAARFGSKKPFKGSGIFTSANFALSSQGLPEINWMPMKTAVDVEI